MVVFDTSYLVAIANERDALHDRAWEVHERVTRGEWGAALLPEYVFVETVTVLLARRGRRLAVATGRALLDARETELVPCGGHFETAWEVFRERGPRTLSFTDATIVSISRARADPHVATFDADLAKFRGIKAIP